MPIHALSEHLIKGLDKALRTLIKPVARVGTRQNPGADLLEADLSPPERRHVAGLMRINHAGEVAAQALYQAQIVTARHPALSLQLTQAAKEEIDHLAWCEQRLVELDSPRSLLLPLWYGGSFIIGALAGCAGDALSLGFLAETEHQVMQHLQSHLDKLPMQDLKTQTIIKQMMADESQHAQSAHAKGGTPLPAFVKGLMHWSAQFLIFTSYYV